MADFPIVEVLWVDSASASGWADKNDYVTTAEIRTIGFLTKEADDYIEISAHLADNGQHHTPFAIPRGAIRKMWTVTL